MTKIHQLRYAEFLTDNGQPSEFLAVSTEDGRILFFFTETAGASAKAEAGPKSHLPTLQSIGQVGGKADGVTNRIKDFEILKLITSDALNGKLLIVGGSSDGSLRLWILDCTQFTHDRIPDIVSDDTHSSIDAPRKKVGQLLGTYETGNRITCLKAFQMSYPVECATPLVNRTGASTKGVNISGDDSTKSA